MITTKVAVLAVSTKKELGWVKLATLDGKSWNDLGAKFNKENLVLVPGIYEMAFENVAKGLGATPQYLVKSAKEIVTFDNILATV